MTIRQCYKRMILRLIIYNILIIILFYSSIYDSRTKAIAVVFYIAVGLIGGAISLGSVRLHNLSSPCYSPYYDWIFIVLYLFIVTLKSIFNITNYTYNIIPDIFLHIHNGLAIASVYLIAANNIYVIMYFLRGGLRTKKK